MLAHAGGCKEEKVTDIDFVEAFLSHISPTGYLPKKQRAALGSISPPLMDLPPEVKFLLATPRVFFGVI